MKQLSVSAEDILYLGFRLKNQKLNHRERRHVVQENQMKICVHTFFTTGDMVYIISQNFAIKFSRPENEIAAGSM